MRNFVVVCLGSVFALGCGERVPSSKPRSLDGFLAPETTDMGTSSTGGTSTGGSTTGGTSTGGTSTGGTSTGGSTMGGSTTGGTTGTGGLDPLLSLASGSGTPCNMPGSPCSGGLEGCRIYNATESRCEAGGTQGDNQTCTTSTDCDVMFMCYGGSCENICPLGNGATIDIGYPGYGVCP